MRDPGSDRSPDVLRHDQSRPRARGDDHQDGQGGERGFAGHDDLPGLMALPGRGPRQCLRMQPPD